MRRLFEGASRHYLARAIKAEHVLVFLVALTTCLLLVVFRALDDNALVSWRWMFSGKDAPKVLLAAASGAIAAYALSKISLPQRYFTPFLFLFSFVVAAQFWSLPEVIVDASRYFTQAKHLEVYGVGYFFKEWGRNIAAWTDLPLIPFIYGLIFKFLGESRIYIQVFTTLLFSATVVLTYKIGNMLWGKKTGFYGGLLLLGIPYIFTQVPLMLVDVPSMFFLTLAIFAFIKAIGYEGRGSIVLSSATIFLAFFSKYSVWLMLSVLPIIFFAYCLESGEWKKGFLRGTAIALISSILLGMAIFYNFDVISRQIKLLVSYQQPGLERWGESFHSTFFFQVHPFLTVAAMYSVYAAVKKKDLRFAVVGWLVFLILLLRVERARYIVPIFPMFALMASYGLGEIKSEDLRRFVVLCAVVASIAVAVLAYLPFLQGLSAKNLWDAGRFLNSTGVNFIEVCVLPARDFKGVNPAVSVPLLDIYSNQRIVYRYSYPSPQLGEIKKSSLRFTWEYDNPKYYTAGGDGSGDNKAVVVISSFSHEKLPGSMIRRLENYRLSKVFKTPAGGFSYHTDVMIFKPLDRVEKTGIKR